MSKSARRYLAIDIGASSGRHIVGWRDGGELITREVYRFPNGMDSADGHLVWDVDRLERETRTGTDIALDLFPDIASLSIDTWGVDYVLIRDGRPVAPCYAYRDTRAERAIPLAHGTVPFAELYARTGAQFQPFNTIYQLYTDMLDGRLDDADGFMMVPEYLMYRLTGVSRKEFTNATTTGLVSARTGEFDLELAERLGLPTRLFPRLCQPGTPVGTYKGIDVLLCATHDTASAVEGIPMDGNQPYISSGTWSLLGVKTPKPLTDERSMAANFSNEGGVNYNRYQKNIMGMWLINRLRDELCPDAPFTDIMDAAERSGCAATVDVNAGAFLAPGSMKSAFDSATGGAAKSVGDYFRCACRSLALSYRDALAELEQGTGQRYDKLYIVGGGAKNGFLNRLTGEATGKTVVALPIEATALGNLLVQERALSAAGTAHSAVPPAP